ncbi:hypothetical protein MIND_00878300 [Mycena indigotica]|uniref:Uncharacterized protein n=1 Tax=Mycena indigotica TaxID=2126181 RepID=A0A8H6VYY0_9AGAR|nr:uncharacterized protein MIND_00878300 [Mycena indigotica]KAF7299294.1 hypothetical protein MIND_00878300 [Mycena indigotica]
MLVLPLLSVTFVAVASAHTAHDSHARRSRQAQAARFRQRADAHARDEGFSLPSLPGNPFATPSESAGPSGSDAGSSVSISLPGATSTKLEPSGSASEPASVSSTPVSDSASASITQPPQQSSEPVSSEPVSSQPAASNTDIFSALSSLLSSVLSPPPSESAIFSSTAIFSASQTITDPPPSASGSASASDPGLSIPLSIPSSIPLSISTTDVSSAPVSVSSTPVSVSQSDNFPPSSSIPGGPSSSVPDNGGPSSSIPDNGGPSSSVVISSSSAVEFPNGPSSSVSVSVSTSTTVSVSVSTTTTVSVQSDLTFILTESSLALASVATTTSLSLSNPDAPTTTISFTASAQTALTTAPLPSGLPSRIYPPNGPPQNPGVGNYSFISLLFDNFLGWEFVCTNSISSTQIFAMMPVILATSLGIPTTDVHTFALQVRVPESYQGSADADQLQTIFLAYIPTDSLDNLALQLKSRNSLFYTGLPGNAVATQLAQHIVSAFALNSVADPDTTTKKNGASANHLNGAVSQSKTRQDAIIGVVSTLGAIAVLVLVFLAYRAFKRRAELAHHRLSDPPDVAGIPPTGRDFDQDSVGGQRRRSFYFAEDSLRGFGGDRQDDMAYDSRGAGMTQRRNVMPAAISAPILQQSSMNW